MQGPEPGKPHDGEAAALGAVVEALTIGVTEHETGQRKEHVDAKLQIGERADVLERMVNRDMEQDDQQRTDAAQRVQCLKSNRSRSLLSQHATSPRMPVALSCLSARP